MHFEKTQKSNPHKLTVNQHIISAKSIERFCCTNGKVEVYTKYKPEKIKAKPNNKLFCVERVWDQRAEAGYMKSIEDSFQSIVSKILSNLNITLMNEENIIVTSYFALWEHRFHRSVNPLNDSELKGILPGESITKDQEEILESKHLGFSRNKNYATYIPSRIMNGLNIQIRIDKIVYEMKDLKWGVVRSIDGEFIYPDNFSGTAIIPMTPTIILLGNSENKVVDKEGVRMVNQTAISSSRSFYFAKNLESCPS